jgi:hypothetical protein
MNTATNRLSAYKQLVRKLEQAIVWLVGYAIIMTCTVIGLSAYIVWNVT